MAANIYNLHNKKKKRSPKGFNFNKKKFILSILLIYIVFMFGRCYLALQKVDADISRLQAKKNLLLAEKRSLLEKKRYVNSNAYIEQVARENLGLVKPGEKLLMLAEPGKVMPLESYKESDIYE